MEKAAAVDTTAFNRLLCGKAALGVGVVVDVREMRWRRSVSGWRGRRDVRAAAALTATLGALPSAQGRINRCRGPVQ